MTKADRRLLFTGIAVCSAACLGIFAFRGARSFGGSAHIASQATTVIRRAAVTETDGSAVTLEGGETVTETIIETAPAPKETEKPGLLERIFGGNTSAVSDVPPESAGDGSTYAGTTDKPGLWERVFGTDTTAAPSTTAGSTITAPFSSERVTPSASATLPLPTLTPTSAPTAMPTSAPTTLPAAPAASEADFSYTPLGDGTVELTAYIGSARTLTVPCMLGGKYVSSVASKAFQNKADLRSITFLSAPDANARSFSLSEEALYNLSSLTDVVLPYELTGFEKSIEACPSLERVTVDKADAYTYKQMYSIDGVLFKSDSGWQYIIFYPEGKRDTEYTITASMSSSYAIRNNPYIKKITFSARNLYFTTGENFRGCTSLEEFDTAPTVLNYFAHDGAVYYRGVKINDNIMTYLKLYPPARRAELFIFSNEVMSNYMGSAESAFCGNPYVKELRFEACENFRFEPAAFTAQNLPSLTTVYISSESYVKYYQDRFSCAVIME